MYINYSFVLDVFNQKIPIEQQEVKDKISFNIPNCYEVYQGSLIVFYVSEAKLSSQIKTVSAVAQSSCTLKFSTDMENLLSAADYADLEIHCKDRKILKCHKNLLAARSPVFKTMLESDFNEGKSGIINLDYMELEFVKVNEALL